MTRVLILIILVWILYLIIKRVAASANTKAAQSDAKEKIEMKILKCTICGCHVPESESQIKDGKVICNNPECQNSEYDK